MSKPKKRTCPVCEIRRNDCDRKDCPANIKEGIVKPEKMDVRK